MQAVDGKIKEERKQAGALGLLLAGRYLLLIGKHDKAKEYLDRAIKLGSSKQVCAAFHTSLLPCHACNRLVVTFCIMYIK